MGGVLDFLPPTRVHPAEGGTKVWIILAKELLWLSPHVGGQCGVLTPHKHVPILQLQQQKGEQRYCASWLQEQKEPVRSPGEAACSSHHSPCSLLPPVSSHHTGQAEPCLQLELGGKEQGLQTASDPGEPTVPLEDSYLILECPWDSGCPRENVFLTFCVGVFCKLPSCQNIHSVMKTKRERT